ncbi:unnamed protein product [Lactuca virosa]|uniref:SWIM-type domain-containing protein n=1 Tax=Lactuca virosa TaxID=75947 RepID=A0AAU9PRV8_9ASTR|nr:unnamed protein product [Lactuca virosa]
MIITGVKMASSEEEWNDPFAALNEPFAGLNEMDFELHGIYMDHEPEHEFVSTLDKCKDNFLNVLLNDANLRNASMSDEMRARVYHENDWESDKDDEEEVQPKYRVHDPNIKRDNMEPKLGDIFESAEQLKFCVANYVVSHGYQIYFAKCDSVRIVAKCGKRNEDNQCPFRLHAAWMYKESQGLVFESRFNYESFKVYLEARTCTCRLWNLSGIPFVHANAAINYIHKTADGYINECFSKNRFIECYQSNIMPVNGSNLWEQTPFQKPLPPIARRMPGRPATKRRRHSSEKETKFATARVKVLHKQSCTSETKPRVPHAPKKIGSPRKNQEEHESATTKTPINQNVDPNQASGSRRKTRRRSTETSNEPNQPTAQRRKINNRRGGGRAGGKGKKHVDEGQVQIEGQKLVGEGKNQDEGQNQQNGQQEVDEGMDGINEILRDIQEEEPEFLEGNADDVIPEKIQLNEEDVAMLLESGYSIGEIEGSKGIAMPLDDMAPVELELQDQEGHPDDVEVFADDEVDDVQVDEVVDDVQVDDVEVVNDVQVDEVVDDVQVDDVEVFADDEGVDEVQVEAGIESAVEGVDDIVNNLPNLSTKPVHRKRKPSERILKLKLKKTMYDKYGSGSSTTKPFKLD